MPHFQQTQENYADDIKVIAINIGINEDLEAINKVKKQFNLSMDIAIDESGDLAQAFNFIGTPYHLLFDKNMNLLHKGHQADKSLDQKLALVSNLEPIPLLDTQIFENTLPGSQLNFAKDQVHALFFTATWCDGYLKESRLKDAKNCMLGQKSINKLTMEYSDIHWKTIVSRLWTDENHLKNYQEKYMLNHSINIDQSNQLFHQFSINNLPTLVLIKNKKIVKITNFDNINNIAKSIAAM